jgi:hemin uptake protein HemP
MPTDHRDGAPSAPAAARAPASAEATARAARATLRISSERLFGGASEVEIDHHGAVYRLKRTALGKLILTK